MPATIATVAASATPVTLKISNAARKALVVINDSASPLRISNGTQSMLLPGTVSGAAPVMAETTHISVRNNVTPTAAYTATWLDAAPTGSAYVIEIT
jgi:hypothetical protein